MFKMVTMCNENPSQCNKIRVIARVLARLCRRMAVWQSPAICQRVIRLMQPVVTNSWRLPRRARTLLAMTRFFSRRLPQRARNPLRNDCPFLRDSFFGARTPHRKDWIFFLQLPFQDFFPNTI
jgi:hypothetical protein